MYYLTKEQSEAFHKVLASQSLGFKSNIFDFYQGKLTSRDEARKLFQTCGLDHTQLRECDIQILYMILATKIREFSKSSWEHRPDDTEGDWFITVSRKITFKKNKNGTIKFCEITLDSQYFKHREAITFNVDGFIGFAGWADNEVLEPILSAFQDWCNYMRGVLR